MSAMMQDIEKEAIQQIVKTLAAYYQQYQDYDAAIRSYGASGLPQGNDALIQIPLWIPRQAARLNKRPE